MPNLDKTQFISRLQKAGFVTIAKFLDVPLNTAKQFRHDGTLRYRLEKRYDDLPAAELADYAAQLQATSIWAKLFNDYHEAEHMNGFIAAHIEAYQHKTDDHFEIIAKVFGARIDGQAQIHVSYQNDDAKVDPGAIQAIHKAERDIRNALNKQLGELRSLKLEEDGFVMYQIIRYETEKPNGTVVAAILKTAEQKTHVTYSSDLLREDKERVEDMVEQILQEQA